MSLAKAVVTGTIVRTPEERFTQNNVSVSSFVVSVEDRNSEPILLRVISKRQSQQEVLSTLSKADRVLVEGSLQIVGVKDERGNERKVFELDANTIEKIGGASAASKAAIESDEPIVKYSDSEEIDDVNELINEEEIPF